MAVRWSDVESKPEFQSLSDEEKFSAQNQFFEENIASQVPENDRAMARSQFLGEYGRGTVDTGQSRAMAGLSRVGRGAAEIIPSTIGGLGEISEGYVRNLNPVGIAARMGIPGAQSLVDLAAKPGQVLRGTIAPPIQEAVETVTPINPLFERAPEQEALGVVGQATGQLASMLIPSKALSLTPKVAQALGLSQAAAMGAKSGGETADAFGVEDLAQRSLMALLYGGAEAGSEAITGFGSGKGTRELLGDLRSFLTGKGAGARFLKTAVGEGLEEVPAGVAQDAITNLFAQEDPNRPGYTKEGVKLPNPLDVESRLKEFGYGTLAGGLFGAGQLIGSRSTVEDALRYRKQTQDHIKSLEGKELSEEEKKDLATLQEEDKNIGSWLTLQGARRSIPVLEEMAPDNPEVRDFKDLVEAADIVQDSDMDLAEKERLLRSYTQEILNHPANEINPFSQESQSRILNPTSPQQTLVNEVQVQAEESEAPLTASALGEISQSEQPSQSSFEALLDEDNSHSQAAASVQDSEGNADRAATRKKFADAAAKEGLTVEEYAKKLADDNTARAKKLASELQDGDTFEMLDGNGNPQIWRVETDLNGEKKFRDMTEGSPAQDFLYPVGPNQVKALATNQKNGTLKRSKTKANGEVIPSAPQKSPVNPSIKSQGTQTLQQNAIPIRSPEEMGAYPSGNQSLGRPEVGQGMGFLDEGQETPRTQEVGETTPTLPTQQPEMAELPPSTAQAAASPTATAQPYRLPRLPGQLNVEPISKENAQAALESYLTANPDRRPFAGNAWIGTTEELAGNEEIKGAFIKSLGDVTPEEGEAAWQSWLMSPREGFQYGGRPFVVLDRVVVNRKDVERGLKYGMTPDQWAVRRLLAHEDRHTLTNFIAAHQDLGERFHHLANQINPDQLDSLARRRYHQYKDWRENKAHAQALQFEWFSEQAEAEFPENPNLIQQFLDWLRDAYARIMGIQPQDVGDQELRDFLRKASEMQAQEAQTETGGIQESVQASQPELPQRPQVTVTYEGSNTGNTVDEVLDSMWPQFYTAWESQREEEGLPLDETSLTAAWQEEVSDPDYLQMRDVQLMQEKRNTARGWDIYSPTPSQTAPEVQESQPEIYRESPETQAQIEQDIKDVPEPMRNFAQVLGQRTDKQYLVQQVKPMVDFARAKINAGLPEFFEEGEKADYSNTDRPPVTEENTKRVFQLATALLDRQNPYALEYNQEIERALGTKYDAAAEVLKLELMDYAVRLASTYKPGEEYKLELPLMLVDMANDTVTGLYATVSGAGRLLNVRGRANKGGFWDAMKLIKRARDQAAASKVGERGLLALTDSQTSQDADVELIQGLNDSTAYDAVQELVAAADEKLQAQAEEEVDNRDWWEKGLEAVGEWERGMLLKIQDKVQRIVAIKELLAKLPPETTDPFQASLPPELEAIKGDRNALMKELAALEKGLTEDLKAIEKVASKLTPEQRKKVAKKVRKAITPQSEAEAILKRYEQKLKANRKEPSPLKKLFLDQVKSPVSVEEFTDKAKALGVDDATAQKLFDTAERVGTERRSKRKPRKVRTIEDMAKGVVDRFAKAFSDTPSLQIKEGKVHPLTAAISAYLDGSISGDEFLFTAQRLGVSSETSGQILTMLDEQLRRSEEIDAARKRQREEETNEKTAQRMVNQFATIFSDTPSLQKKETENAVKKLTSQYLEGAISPEELLIGLSKLKVSDKTAGRMLDMLNEQLRRESALEAAEKSMEVSKETAQAKSFISRIDDEQTEWLPKGNESGDTVAGIVKESYKDPRPDSSGMTRQQFISYYSYRLSKLGSDEVVAYNLAERLWLKNRRLKVNEVIKKRSSAESSKNTKSLQQAVRKATTQQLGDMQWKRDQVVEHFMGHGFMSEEAKKAVAEMSDARIERMVERAQLEVSRKDAEAKKAKDEKDRQFKIERPDKLAQAEIDKFDEAQTDILKGEKAEKEAVIKIRDQALNDARADENHPRHTPAEGFVRKYSALLEEAGVSPAKSQTLARRLWDANKRMRGNRFIKRRASVANSQQFVNQLVEKILNAPISLQTNPAWRKQVMTDAFASRGLEPRMAEAAAEALDSTMKQQWKKAKIHAAQKAAKRLGIKGLPMEAIIQSINSEAFSSTDPITKALAEQAGFKELPKAKVARMAWLSEQIQNPSTTPTEAALWRSELESIVESTQMPKALLEVITRGFENSALSGTSNFGVNYLSTPFTLARRALIDNLGILASGDKAKFTQAVNNILSLKDVVTKRFANEVKNSWKNDAYSRRQIDYLNKSYSLRQEIRKNLDIWNDPNASGMAKANAALKIVYSSTDLVRRILSVADQAWGATMEQYFFRTEGMRELLNKQGLEPKEARLVTEMAVAQAQDRTNARTQELAKQGVSLDPSTVSLMQQDYYNQAIREYLNLKEEGSGERVAETADKEAAAEIGAIPSETPAIWDLPQWMFEGVKAGSQAVLNKVPGPLGRMLVGFVSVPANVVNRSLYFTPVGLLRAWHKAKGPGREKLYNEMMATSQQRRTRIIEGLAGSIGIALAMALNGDDDDKDGFGVEITGQGPKNMALREAWMKRHKQNAVEITIGGRKYSVPYGRGGFEGVAIPFAAAGALSDMRLNKTDRKDATMVGRWLAQTAAAFFEQARFLGAKSYAEALSKPSGTTAAKSAAFTGSGMIPFSGFLKSLGRVASGQADQTSIESALKANIPVANFFSERKLNFLGDPTGRDSYLDRMWYAGVPFGTSEPGDVPNADIYKLLIQKGYAPAFPSRTYLEGRNGMISDEKWESYVKRRGSAIKAKIRQQMGQLKSASPTEFDNLLDRITSESTKEVKESMRMK